MNQPNFQERRNYKRIRKPFVMTYFDLRQPDQKFCATQIKNISKGGMCLITEQTFEPGTTFGIEIKAPFFVNVTLITGHVLESHEKVKEIIYETRLQFENLSPDAEKIIEQCVEFFQNRENDYD